MAAVFARVPAVARRQHVVLSTAFVLLALLSAWKPGTGVAPCLAYLATVFGVVFRRPRGQTAVAAAPSTRADVRHRRRAA